MHIIHSLLIVRTRFRYRDATNLEDLGLRHEFAFETKSAKIVHDFVTPIGLQIICIIFVQGQIRVQIPKLWSQIQLYELYSAEYGCCASDLILNFRKAYTKICKIRLVLKFIRTCRKEHLVPTFIRFRLPPLYIRYESSFKKCHQDMLKCEMKSKKRALSKLYRQLGHIKKELAKNLGHLTFRHILTIVHELSVTREIEYVTTHNKKIAMLRNKGQPTWNSTPTSYEYPKNVVRNFSKRNLTDDEIQPLSNGLDFVYHSRNFDDQVLVTNIENCFVSLMGEVIDKREHDIMDSEERIQYKLTPEQLKYAHTIRQLTDNFRTRASKILNQHSTIDQKIHDTIRNLSKDRSIFITKADKGRSIVILNRTDYIQKIESIITDKTTFKILQKDPTLTNEDKLIRKLRELKAGGFMTDKEYQFCYPAGSQPARLYGSQKYIKKTYQ